VVFPTKPVIISCVAFDGINDRKMAPPFDDAIQLYFCA